MLKNLISVKEFRFSVKLIRGDNGLFGFHRDGVRVVKITKGSPAEKCRKIKIGDEIVAINNFKILTMDNSSVVLKNSGTSVIITFRRNN